MNPNPNRQQTWPRRAMTGLAILTFASSCRGTSVDEHVRRANAYFDQSRWSEAIIEYRQALQDAPKRGDIHQKLAEAYVRNRDGSNARREFVRAADLLPDDVSAQLKAGNILLLGDAFDDAQARANKVLTLNPK